MSSFYFLIQNVIIYISSSVLYSYDATMLYAMVGTVLTCGKFERSLQLRCYTVICDGWYCTHMWNGKFERSLQLRCYTVISDGWYCTRMWKVRAFSITTMLHCYMRWLILYSHVESSSVLYNYDATLLYAMVVVRAFSIATMLHCHMRWLVLYSHVENTCMAASFH